MFAQRALGPHVVLYIHPLLQPLALHRLVRLDLKWECGVLEIGELASILGVRGVPSSGGSKRVWRGGPESQTPACQP